MQKGDFKKLVDWVYSVNPLIPLHFSRYFPHYKFTVPETPVSTLKRAFETAKSKLPYVYVGNIFLDDSADTLCPNCGNMLVKRQFYSVNHEGIQNGICSSCGSPVDIVGI